MACSGLTPAQRYLFDLRGFLILRNVISPTEIEAARTAITANMHRFHERAGGLLNSRLDQFKGNRGRLDCGTMLTWDKPHCEIFRRFLAHNAVIHALNELCGKGFRLDHLPLAIIQYKGAEGFDLHGGNVDSEGNWQQDLSYECRYGKISCNLLNVAIPLDATANGDGGFVIVPGSHKANFPIPGDLEKCDNLCENEYLLNPRLDPGDVLLFTEAATHGAFPWQGATECRRTLFYRYCPPNFAYGRGYLDKNPGLAAELEEKEAVVLQAPFVNRLDRKHLNNDGTVGVTKRSEEKIEFDRGVFDNKYF
eukprot:sb/3467156/